MRINAVRIPYLRKRGFMAEGTATQQGVRNMSEHLGWVLFVVSLRSIEVEVLMLLVLAVR